MDYAQHFIAWFSVRFKSLWLTFPPPPTCTQSHAMLGKSPMCQRLG